MLRPTLFSTALILGVALASARAQSAQPLTSVDVYGLRTVDEGPLRAAIGVSAGDALAEGTAAIAARVEALPEVAEARAVVIGYPGHRALFVGVREVGRPAAEARPAPSGDVRLDPELVALARRRLELLSEAIAAGEAGEDHEHGYALSHYRPMRTIELAFVDVAAERFEELATVLRESSDAEARAAAATIVAYGSDKAAVGRALERAARDPDSAVRNNAVRALSILCEHAQRRPALDLDVDAGPLLELLGSLEWTDRNKGSFAVDALTQSRDPELLERLSSEYLDELTEMALWRSTGHAFSSLRVLARLAGRPEDALTEGLGDANDPAARRAWVDACVQAIRARPGRAVGGADENATESR